MNPVIELDHVTKTFGARRGITEVTLQVDRGEVFGFLGPNGAGKSTTIRLMLGLYRGSAGRMRIFGRDPVRDSAGVHARVGYLPGELFLHPRLTGRWILDRFARMRGLVDLRLQGELVERFGVELDPQVRHLSKGNRQKLGIVLAFMHRPDLLILDEPTSGLDPLLQDEFAALVREAVAAGQTVFLSSHELDEVQRLVDRLAIIKEGRLVVTDTVAGLRRAAPRTITLQFPGPVDAAPFAALEDVTVVNHHDGRLVLALTGAVAGVLRLAADLDPIDITARPADLDELFLTYYRDREEVPA